MRQPILVLATLLVGSAFSVAIAQESMQFATPFNDQAVRMSEGVRYTTPWKKNYNHHSIDYSKRVNGSPVSFIVRAPADGFAARESVGALGNVIYIVHVNYRGDPVYYTSLFAHLKGDTLYKSLPEKKEGLCKPKLPGSTWSDDECNFASWKRVLAGEPIANAGNTGGGYAIHLHMEVSNALGRMPSRRIDPYGVDSNVSVPSKNLYRYTDCGDNHLWSECPITSQSLSSGSFPIRDNDSEVILFEPNPPGVLMFGSIDTAFTHENLPELKVNLTDSTGAENTVKAEGSPYCWPDFGDLSCNNASVEMGNSRLGKPVPSSWAFEFTDTAADNVGSVIDLTISATTHNVALSSFIPSAPLELYKKQSSLCVTTSPALAANGKFYGTAQPDCSSAIGRGVVEIEPSTGTINWGPTIASGCSYTGSQGVSVGSSGLVYATGDWNACRRGNLIAVRQSDGGIEWDHGDCPGPSGNTSPHPRQIPAIDESLGSIYFGSSQLCSVDMDTGVNNWNRSGGRYIGGKGIVIDSLGNVSYGTYDRSLFNTIRSYTSMGTFKWERIVGRSRSIIGAVTSNDSLLVNYSPSTTALPNAIHEVSSSGNISTWPISGIKRPVFGSAGVVYANIAGTSDVVSIDEATKTENWRETLSSSEEVLVDFVTAEGLIIARSGSVLYALNTTNGSVAWQYAADSLIHIAARLTATGDIFFSDDLSNVYLLDTKLSYAASIWPIAEYGDAQHSQKVGP